MAAFEPAVSRLVLPKLQLDEDTEEVVDFRTATLPPERPPFDGFDPRDHRRPKKPISVTMAYINLLRTGFGAGMLGLPLAVSQAGMALGPIMIAVVGGLVLNSYLTLLWCLNEISRQLRIPMVPYRYGFRIALLHGPAILHFLGRCGPAIVGSFMVLSQLGICTVCVIFTADSLRDIMDWESSTTAMATLLVPYLVLEYLMKNLSIISYISMTGTVFNILGMILVFYHIFNKPHGNEIIKATHEPLPLFFAFGTFMFNLTATGVVISLERALLEPRTMTRRRGILEVGIIVPTVVGAVFGALGYWSFGTMEENVLRSLPFDDWLSLLAIALYLTTIALTYPIQCYPAIQLIMDVLRHHFMSDYDDTKTDQVMKGAETIGRPCFVCMSFLVCYLAPYQGPFVAFVGNLCTTQLCLVFPALMELCMIHPDYGPFKIYLIKNLILIALGLTMFTVGVYLCAKLIYVRVVNGSDVFTRNFFMGRKGSSYRSIKKKKYSSTLRIATEARKNMKNLLNKKKSEFRVTAHSLNGMHEI